MTEASIATVTAAGTPGGGGQLSGRVGVLTGTATGIGRAGALRFAREGAAIVALDSNAEEGQRTVDLVTEQGGRAEFLHGDVSSEIDVVSAISRAAESFGPVNLLWGNAGMGVYKSATETSKEEWERIWNVNVTGNFLLAKHGIPHLVASGGGTVVFTASVNAFVGDREWAAYCATKGAIVGFARALAVDHAAEGVRVNCVCPASTDTPLQEQWLRRRLTADTTYEQAVRADQAAHLLDRYATPEEVAAAALFLSSDESSFSTGSVLMVDGGLTAV